MEMPGSNVLRPGVALPASRAVFHGRYETARPANRTAAYREENLCARRKRLGYAELHARVSRYRHGQRNFLEGAEETCVKSFPEDF